MAVLVRLPFFTALNLGAGRPVLEVGITIRIEKALRWLTAWLSWQPETLRLVVWLLSVSAACLLFIVNWK
ncbi:MAG: hypothetical protein EOO62_04165 [Hymenobacter sp.]|nr:MAG: hypothetical protein EOO62_04165 [Hymenobacter sp.]